jgi:hypothetical protein
MLEESVLTKGKKVILGTAAHQRRCAPAVSFGELLHQSSGHEETLGLSAAS